MHNRQLAQGGPELNVVWSTEARMPKIVIVVIPTCTAVDTLETLDTAFRHTLDTLGKLDTSDIGI